MSATSSRTSTRHWGEDNGDIPRFLANGDRTQGLRWRRRAVRSFGQTGTCEVWRYACPRLTLFAPSRSRALRKLPDGNLRRSLVGSLRALTSAKLVIGEASRRPVWASSSPRSIRSQRESAVDRRTTRRALSPFARKTARHASAATIRSSIPICRAIAVCPRGWKRSQDPVFWFLLRPGVVRSSPSSGKRGRAALASTRGQCGAGGRAFRGLTRSATEWSAARRKPLRAAALHLSAAISADVKARRLPTSGRRKFPSGNFRSARDLEGAERVNPRKARPPTPQLHPRLLAIEECPHFFTTSRRASPRTRKIARVFQP